MRKMFAFAAATLVVATAPAAAQETKVAIGMSGWTGFQPLTLAQGRRDLQEERPRRFAQDDPAEGPSPGDRVRRHPVRGHHGRDVDRLERERRGHQADLPDGQELWRRRDGRSRQRREDRRPQGQDRRRLRAGDRAVFHAGLVPEEERAVGEGRHRRQPRARGRRAGVRRRPERRRDDLRALPVDGARQSRTPARSSRPRSTTR